MSSITDLPPLAPAVQPSTPSTRAPQGSERKGTFAAKLAGQPSPVATEAVTGGDVMSSVLAEVSAKDFATDSNRSFTHSLWAGEAHQANAQLEKTQVDLFKDNPFGPPDAAQRESIASLANQSDPSSMMSRMLRLQFRMQRESLRYSFASNSMKGDHDDRKSVLNNIR